MSTEETGALEPSLPAAAGEERPEGAREVAGSGGIRDLLVILRAPDSHASESFRTVRTSLQRHLAAGVKALMILSPWGGDGKSSVCANLAASLSQLFIDVILVDADVRKPTLSKVFQTEGGPGLTDCLEHGVEVDQVIRETGVERLRFVPAGSTSMNPADLLGRDRLGTVLGELQSRCQCLIVDTSPLTACGDALLIGSHVDRALMVINPKNWQGDAEARVRDLLQEHKIEVLGVVLNATDDAAEGGYGYGYGYGYGHGSAPSGEPGRNPGSGAARRSPHGAGRGASSRGGPLQRLWQRLRSGGRERE